ncbi:MAG: SxtJ family membrane protein [Acidobacteriota bacterium]|nr:SxtJ family membrane protein [Acidobacteriota bacterium]
MSATHEDFTRKIGHKGPSNRNFGFVFTAIFLIFGLLPLRHGKPIRVWCLAVSAAVLLITLARPSLLTLPNKAWSQVGILLGKVVNPIVTGLLFYLVFTPFAIVLRWMGKDLMGVRIDRGAKTYWAERHAWRERSELTNQF